MSEQLAPSYHDSTDDAESSYSSRTTVPDPVTTGWPSVTKKYRTPDGTIYVTVAGTGDDTWIDCTVGKGGTLEQACAHALAALAGTAIRYGTPPEKVAYCLRGVTHERSVRFGNDALSVPDALGFAIQDMA